MNKIFSFKIIYIYATFPVLIFLFCGHFIIHLSTERHLCYLYLFAMMHNAIIGSNICKFSLVFMYFHLSIIHLCAQVGI